MNGIQYYLPAGKALTSDWAADIFVIVVFENLSSVKMFCPKHD